MKSRYQCVSSVQGQWSIERGSKIQLPKQIQLRQKSQAANEIFRILRIRYLKQCQSLWDVINDFGSQDNIVSKLNPFSMSCAKRSIFSGASTQASPRSAFKNSQFNFTDQQIFIGAKQQSLKQLVYHLKHLRMTALRQFFVIARLRISERTSNQKYCTKLSMTQLFHSLHKKQISIKSSTFVELKRRFYNIKQYDNRKLFKAVKLITKLLKFKTMTKLMENSHHKNDHLNNLSRIWSNKLNAHSATFFECLFIINRRANSFLTLSKFIDIKQRNKAFKVILGYTQITKGFRIINKINDALISFGHQQMKLYQHKEQQILIEINTKRSMSVDIIIGSLQSVDNDLDIDFETKISILSKEIARHRIRRTSIMPQAEATFREVQTINGSIRSSNHLEQQTATQSLEFDLMTHQQEFKPELDKQFNSRELLPSIKVTSIPDIEEQNQLNFIQHFKSYKRHTLRIPNYQALTPNGRHQSLHLQSSIKRSVSLSHQTQEVYKSGEEIEISRKLICNFTKHMKKSIIKQQEVVEIDNQLSSHVSLKTSSKWKTFQQTKLSKLFALKKSYNNQVRIFTPTINPIFSDFQEKDKLYTFPGALKKARVMVIKTPKQSLFSVLGLSRPKLDLTERAKYVLINIKSKLIFINILSLQGKVTILEIKPNSSKVRSIISKTLFFNSVNFFLIKPCKPNYLLKA